MCKHLSVSGCCVPNHQDLSVLALTPCLLSPLCMWSAAFVLQRWKKIPFQLLLSFPSPWHVSVCLTGKSEDSPNTVQGAHRKVLLGGKQSLLWLDSSSSKIFKKKTLKVFLFTVFSRFRLSWGREWSASLTAGWGRGSCRCWRLLRRGRTKPPETERCWTWTLLGRWWPLMERGTRCGPERSSRRRLERGKRTLVRGRKWLGKGSWKQGKLPIQMLLLQLLRLFSQLSCLSAVDGSWCASFAHHCGQICGRKSHKQKASRLCECGCVSSGGRCGWSYACRCGTERAFGLCGCECDESAHPSARSDGRRFLQDKRKAAHVEGSCWAS